jgi:hypothetical protein
MLDRLIVKAEILTKMPGLTVVVCTLGMIHTIHGISILTQTIADVKIDSIAR